METKQKKLVIYSLKVANELTRRGHKILDTAPNFKFPEYRVFIFENSNLIHKDLKEIKNKLA